MWSANQYFQSFTRKLSETYGADEARAISSYLTSELLLIKYHQLTIIDKELSDADVAYFDAILNRLLKHEPLQYILGYTWFCGMKFSVNEHVLIPRPETEELVDLVVEHCRKNNLQHPIVLDLGTGSGCIPVSVKKNIPGAKVFGTDIMEDALKLAEQNAWTNKADVTFFKDDMLDPSHIHEYGPFDIIISNPPYIAETEAGEMALHVTQHEPHVALFSPGDPLAFYKAIRRISDRCLAPGGSIWLEINPLLAEETRSLFDNETVHYANIINDMSGKKRFVVSGS